VSVVPQPELDACTSGVGEMVRLAGVALEHATAALLQQDPPPQESMAACGRALHTLDHALEDHAATVLAARGRLGTDQLPMVLVAVHVNAEVEALGTLARQLGEIAVDRYSRPAFPTEVSVASASEASLAARYSKLGVAHAAAVIEHGALLTDYPAPG